MPELGHVQLWLPGLQPIGCLQEESRVDAAQAIDLLPVDMTRGGTNTSCPSTQRSETTTPVTCLRVLCPCEDECRRLPSHSIPEHMKKAVISQRQIPKMLLEAVLGTLLELWTISKQASFGPNQQEFARAMFLLAPRWLWPEPAKGAGERHLIPHIYI